MWNGAIEAVKMAALADSFEVNVAPHNFCGHLQTLIGAQFAAAIPNFRVLELDVDSAPWLKSFFTHPPVVEKGDLVLPTRPGWGTDINEEALKAHPPKKLG
jgi:L-alanine-DL-glutamate epimerase-like enolase superfamily enzyme